MRSGAVVVVVVVALCSCQRAPPMTRVRVSLEGDGATAAVVVVEGAVSSLAGSRSVRSVACADAAVVEVNAGPDAAAAVKDALAKVKLPADVFVDVRTVEDEVVVLAVRGSDPFVARTFVDAQLATPLSKVAGVVGVKVLGGRRERQVRVDLERMLARDVSLPELAQAAGGGASLEATIVRDQGSPPAEPTMTKGAEPTPSSAAVKLVDVATIGPASAGEPLRRDGAVSVRVLGAAGARAAVIKAAAAVARPAGIDVAALDDDSVESADLILIDATPEQVLQAQRTVLGIPGVHLAENPSSLQVIVDEKRALELGVSSNDVARVAAIAAGDGFVLVRNTENVVLRLERAVPLELMGQLIVARSAAGPVRLLDVARIETRPARSDRLDGKAVQRLRLSFDVGVRKRALAALDQELRSLKGVRALIERDDIGAGVCP